jgi:hypothetical protein
MAQDQPDADDAPAEPACELKGENGMVSMLLCPEELEAEQYAAEGRIACEGRAPCGAWIWTDVAAVPAEAPDAHDKLPKESVQKAVAIWVNDNQQLMMLKKEPGN